MYPHLQSPREYKNDGKFSYDTLLRLRGADAVAFKAVIDGFMEEARKELNIGIGLPPYKDAVDKETGQVLEGVLDFKFRVRASIPTKDGPWDRKPAIFDAANAKVPDSERVGGGSKARIAFMPYLRPYQGAAGVTLQPEQVQVLDLQRGSDFGGTSAFEKAEGYSAPAGAPAAEADLPAGDAAPPPADGSGF